jgi:hypothetical protein
MMTEPEAKEMRNNAKLVTDFSVDMLKKLNENNHKDHWCSCSFEHLTHRLFDEILEMHIAIEWQSYEEAIRECADVANFAAMIADNCRRILKEHKL